MHGRSVGTQSAGPHRAGAPSSETACLLSISLEIDEANLPEGHVLALARILQEAASNSVRHGGAAFIQAELRKEGDSLLFSVQDDGRGFDAGRYAGTDFETLRTTGHRGLANINERVRMLHGAMRLESQPGDGCRIEIVFPAPPFPEENQYS